MNESPMIRPRTGAFRSGSGPRQPHELVVWNDSGMTPSWASTSALRTSGISGRKKKLERPCGKAWLRLQKARRLGRIR